MNLFEAVKGQVTARDVAEHYGIHVNHYGMAVCPFHSDRNPSMKLDRRFHCFACGADGDVINFVARLFGLKNGEAAKKIAADFGVAYSRSRASPAQTYQARKLKNQEKIQQERFNSAQRRFFQIFCDYRQRLDEWEKRYAPVDMDGWDHLDSRFEEALQNKSRIDYILDSFIGGSTEDIAGLIAQYGKEASSLGRRFEKHEGRRQEKAGRGNDGPGILGRDGRHVQSAVDRGEGKTH